MAGTRNPKSTDPKASKPKGPKVNHTAVLVAAVTSFVAGTTDAAALAATFRAIPAIGRNKPFGHGLKAAGPKMAEVLDIFNGVNDEAKPSTSRVKPQVSDDVKSLVLVAAVLALVSDFATADHIGRLHTVAMANGDLFDSTFAKVSKLVSGVTVGSDRTQVVGTDGQRITLKHLVEAGVIPAGTKLTGPNKAEATVNADGTVTYNGAKVSLSKASTTAKKHQQNGWDFWKMNGALIGPLRQQVQG